MANYFAKSWHPWVFSSLFVLAAWPMGVSWVGVLMLAVLTLIWGLLDYRNRKKLTQGEQSIRALAGGGELIGEMGALSREIKLGASEQVAKLRSEQAQIQTLIRATRGR